MGLKCSNVGLSRCANSHAAECNSQGLIVRDGELVTFQMLLDYNPPVTIGHAGWCCWINNLGSCFMPSQTNGPFGSILSTLTARGSPGFQTGYVLIPIWKHWGSKPGSSSIELCPFPAATQMLLRSLQAGCEGHGCPLLYVPLNMNLGSSLAGKSRSP